MNQNDILAQQQVMLNQLAQNSQHVIWGVLAIQFALFILTAWVIYMFYARLRDIADELRKLRVAFEMSEDRKSRVAASPRQPGSPPGEERFMPKS